MRWARVLRVLGWLDGLLSLAGTLHDEGMRIGELDVDFFLRDPWEFSVQVVGIFGLAYVKTRSEGPGCYTVARGEVAL